MEPCDLLLQRQAPALYTYYAIMSLLVIILAISLIWLPLVKFITEINTIMAKLVTYFNTELLGYQNACLVNALFLSERSLMLISASCVAYVLYLASNDFLLFVTCYICNLPDSTSFEKPKMLALRVIRYLLNMTNKKRMISGRQNIPPSYPGDPK